MPAIFRFGKRIGERWKFAVEFEAYVLPDGTLPRLWNEWWGTLWLWVNGSLVGDTTEIETVMNDLGSLHTIALATGTRRSNLLSAQSPQKALEIVMWAVYGDEDETMRAAVGRESLEHFEVLPRGKAFFNGWQAILLEAGNEEHFICRHGSEAAVDVVWPLGTFRDIVFQAKDEFEKLARSNLIGGGAAESIAKK